MGITYIAPTLSDHGMVNNRTLDVVGPSIEGNGHQVANDTASDTAQLGIDSEVGVSTRSD